VRVLGRLFRGKLLDALARLHRSGGLELTGALGALRDPQTWSSLLARLYAKDWVVYEKPPFDRVDSVYAYLGRYTHRIGLSNRRLLDVTDERVTLATRHGKSTSLPPRVFLRRFLEHVLPHGFVRIRRPCSTGSCGSTGRASSSAPRRPAGCRSSWCANSRRIARTNALWQRG